jgi:hypothetical protein
MDITMRTADRAPSGLPAPSSFATRVLMDGSGKKKGSRFKSYCQRTNYFRGASFISTQVIDKFLQSYTEIFHIYIPSSSSKSIRYVV